MSNVRSRKLLDLAHRVEVCMNCHKYTPGCEPAHENGIVAGKGFGIKSGDHRHAAMCHACHRFYDQGSVGRDPSERYTASKEDKAEMWNAAHKKTYDHYWQQGWIKVAA